MTDDLPDHTNYSLIKAVDELGNLVTVLADSSGRIVSVMKGDYAGSMKTLAVDEKGRIQAVLTDPEDVFGNPNYIGAGELAVRLGSIKSYEQRGNVVFLEDFECSTLKWATSTSGAGSSVARSNAYALSGNYSLKLVAAALASSYARISKKMPLPVFKKVGFETAFTTESTTDEFTFDIYYYDRTYKWRSIVYFSRRLGALLLFDKDAGWVTFDNDVKVYDDPLLFNQLKYTVDLEKKTYLGCFFNNKHYDLSGYNIPWITSSTENYLELLITLNGDVSYGSTSYVDHVIYTQNEP